MKKYTVLGTVISERRKALEAKALSAKRANDRNAVLTIEEQAAIDKELQTLITAEMLAEQPEIDPATMVKAFNENGIPELELASPNEYSKRKEKQIRANMAYSGGLLNINKYIPGYGSFQRPRSQEGACRQMTPEELQEYVSCFSKTEESYYNNPRNMMEIGFLSPEERKAAIKENQQRINRMMLTIIKRVIDKYADNLDENMSDDELIDKFPAMAKELDFIQESGGILDDVNASSYFEDFPPAEIARYKAIVTTLMAKSAILTKRIQMMADPNYAHIRLEKALQLNPNTLYQADPSISLGDPEGDFKIDMDGPIPYKAYDDPKDIPAPSMAAPTEYGKQLDTEANIVTTAGDIGFSMRLLHEANIAGKLGLSFEQLNAEYDIFDKTGKQLSSEISPTDHLEENDVIYYVSKYGNGTVLPVMLDKAKDGYFVRIGSEEIAASEDIQAAAPQAPGFFASIGNFFHKLFNGGELSETYVRYNAALAEYNKKVEYNQSRRNAGDGTFEDAIHQINRRNAARNEELQKEDAIKSRQDAIRKNVDFLANIPTAEESPVMLDNVLAALLVNKAFTEPADSKFRTVMFDLLGYNNENFNEKDAVNVFRSTDRFKEFAWKIRRYKENLIEELESGDMGVANRALKEIQDEFTSEFYGASKDRPSPREYTNLVEKRAADAKVNTTVADNAILSPDNRKLQDARHDNASLWDAVLAVYGPERKFRPEWTPAMDKHIYDIDDWLKMKEQEVDLEELKPEDRDIDERTFASLAMLLCLRESEFFNKLPNLDGKDLPDTQPFEDILLDIDRPRDGMHRLLPVLIEPTRANLINYLQHMDEVIPGTDPEATGKELLAKEIAKALKIYTAHAKNFSWGNREQSVLTEVCDKVMDFAYEHGMTDLVKQNGLEKDDIEDIMVASALGKITKDAYEAQYDLVRDAEGSIYLTGGARAECVKRMMLLKAIQADAEGSKRIVINEVPKLEDYEDNDAYNKALDEWTKAYVKQQNGEVGEGFKYSETAKAILSDQSYLDDLSMRMMDKEERSKLVDAGSKEIYNAIHLGVGDKLQTKWAEYLKANEAKEKAHHVEMNQIKDLYNRLYELEHKNDNWNLTPAADDVIRNGAPECRRLLLSLDDDKLVLLNKEFIKNPEINLNEMLLERIKEAGQLNKQPVKEAEVQPEGPNMDGPALQN